MGDKLFCIALSGYKDPRWEQSNRKASKEMIQAFVTRRSINNILWINELQLNWKSYTCTEQSEKSYLD